MGYEIEIHIGRLSDGWGAVALGRWLDEIAVIDLCKPGYDSKIYQVSKEKSGKPAFFYGTDGDTRITEDRYGKSLTALPIEDVIDAIQRDAERSKYSRFHIALATLLSVQKYYPGAMCVLYGY